MTLRARFPSTKAAVLLCLASLPHASLAQEPPTGLESMRRVLEARLGALAGVRDPAVAHARAAAAACESGGSPRERAGACTIAAAALDLAEARARLVRARAAARRFGVDRSRPPSGEAVPSASLELAEARTPDLEPGDRATARRLHDLAVRVRREAVALEGSLAASSPRTIGDPPSVLAARLAEAAALETLEEATADELRRYGRVEREREATRRAARAALLASVPRRIESLRSRGVSEDVLAGLAERAVAARREPDLGRSLLAAEDLADDLAALERSLASGAGP